MPVETLLTIPPMKMEIFPLEETLKFAPDKMADAILRMIVDRTPAMPNTIVLKNGHGLCKDGTSFETIIELLYHGDEAVVSGKAHNPRRSPLAEHRAGPVNEYLLSDQFVSDAAHLHDALIRLKSGHTDLGHTDKYGLSQFRKVMAAMLWNAELDMQYYAQKLADTSIPSDMQVTELREERLKTDIESSAVQIMRIQHDIVPMLDALCRKLGIKPDLGRGRS